MQLGKEIFTENFERKKIKKWETMAEINEVEEFSSVIIELVN